MDPFNPEESIRGGCEYLARQKANVQIALQGHPVSEDDVLRFALASYNAGWGHCREAIRKVIADGHTVAWLNVAEAFKVVAFRGKRPDWKQVLAYVDKILPAAPATISASGPEGGAHG